MKVREAYTFDDLLLVPRHSTIKSRDPKYIDTSVDLGKGVQLSIPIISANMTNVTGHEMANVISGWGGLPILHRFCTIAENVEEFRKCTVQPQNVGCSIGVQREDRERAEAVVSAGCRILCVDVAHGDHELVIDIVRYLSKTYPEILIIAGNVATAEGAWRLHGAGADVIKIGIGPGSLCTTRIETGNGVPQMTALSDVFKSSCSSRFVPADVNERCFKIVADGGIRNPGDIVKALCFSDAVMLGSVLAGTDEAPGRIVKINGVPHKEYEGSSTHKTSHIEGVKALVQCKGSAKDIIDSTMEGVRSGLSYQGCENLNELKEGPEFVKVTNAGLIENHPHDVIIR